MSSVPMTKSGLEKLKDELKKLKTVDRPQNVKDIEEARAHGDLSENAEYHAAKERQSHIAGRIAQVEDWIARAEVIDVSKIAGEKVVFGATVTLADVETDKKVTYRIVGELEADLKKGLISVTSPISRGMIGREVGDMVNIQAPGGVREYEITEVKFVEESPVA
ncbi:MAG: transcription elongation factor GreA [Deltaproteobacteria bacterium]|nr:transcription elongation factor GreA [Deltaproteobacteria bacterium]